MWGEYCELLDKFPAEKRHQRIHAGHSCWVLPEEEKFLTEPVLKASSMIGTRDQLIERLSDLKAAGLEKGSGTPQSVKAGSISKSQVSMY